MRISDWSSDVCSSDLFQAGDEGLESLVLALFLADRGERAAQIIGDREDIAREFGRGIGMRVGDLLFGAAADILRLGARIEQVDRKSVVLGKGVAVRVGLGGRRMIKKKKINKINIESKTANKIKKKIQE